MGDVYVGRRPDGVVALTRRPGRARLRAGLGAARDFAAAMTLVVVATLLCGVLFLFGYLLILAASIGAAYVLWRSRPRRTGPRPRRRRPLQRNHLRLVPPRRDTA